MPQLPQVSHGCSSTRSITVPLGVVTGVGVGAGVDAGVGAGVALAVVEAVLPPQEASMSINADIRRAE